MASRKKRSAADAPATPEKRAKVWPHSMPFIVFDHDKFTVNPAAIEFLESLGTLPLSPICLAGPYRSGKSFLLNRIMLQAAPGTGFSVGGTTNACTKGLHLATTILKSSNSSDGDYGILVIDTEGLGAVSASDTHDCRIFSLALLLSSVFVYNSKGTIDQPAINNLSLVANISELIRSGTGGDVSAFIPSFLWVVRDFALDLVSETGQAITEDEYLESALVPVDGVSPERNKVRASIRTYFNYRSCRTLIRPCDNEADLKNVNTLPDAALNAKFVQQAAALREKIITQARPKQACGTRLTGALLVRLALVYCEAINKGQAPVIKDAWSLISSEECQKAVQHAEAAFLQLLQDHQTKAIDAQGNRQPIPAAALEHLFTQGFEVAAQKYKGMAIGDRSDEFRDQLRNNLRKHAEQLRGDNMAIITQHAEHLCRLLNESFMHCESFEHVRQQFLKLETQFFKQVGHDMMCRGAWSEQTAKHVWDWASRYHVALNETCVEVRGKMALLTVQQTQWEKEQTLVQQQREAQAAAAVAQEQQWQHSCRELQEQNDELHHQVRRMQAELTQQVEDLDQTDQRYQKQLVQLQTEMETQQQLTHHLSKDLEAAQLKVFTDTNQLQSVQNELGNAQHEVQELRPYQQTCVTLTQQVQELEEAQDLQDRHVAELTQQLNKTAADQRQEIDKLHTASKETIAQLQAAKETSLARQREAQQACQDAKQEVKELQHAKQQTQEVLQRLQVDHTKTQADLEQLRVQQNKERADSKAELADVRAEASKNVKKFQQQLEENATKEREEARKRAAKTREEVEKMFQEKVTALARAQQAEAQAAQQDSSLKELRDTLLREREATRLQNYAGKLHELEGKLATATTRHELLQASLAEKADVVADQQSQLTDLQAQLRQIHQQYAAEKMQLELQHARQLGALQNN